MHSKPEPRARFLVGARSCARRLALVASLHAVVAGAGCEVLGGRPSATDSKLLVGRANDALGLDPARVTDSESAEVCEQIYEPLVRYAPGAADPEPALAERWEVSTDGTEWIFHLRPGVRFHDGTPLDADAVVFSFERQRNPQHPFHRRDFVHGPVLRNIVRVDKLDPLTVRIGIERAYAPFLADLSTFALGIVSPTAVQRLGESFVGHPVGTGPFRFVEWLRGERITLAANPDYWGGAPSVKHLVFVAVRDARQRLVEIEGGAIDVAERLDPADLQFVAMHPELKLDRVAGNNVSYLAMNTQHPPFDDQRVRAAVNHAIDHDPILELVYQGTAIPARGPLAPSVWGHFESTPYPYDPARARALLAEAGLPKARGRGGKPRRLKLYVTSAARPYLPSPELAGEMIARQLLEVGLDVEVVVNPFDLHQASVKAGVHDLCLHGWSGDNGDPDNFLYGLFDSDNAIPGSARNLAFLHDPQLHGILRWAQESQDRGRRTSYYAEAQRIIAERAPWVPIAHAEIVVARRSGVSGISVEPSAIMHFRGARVEAR